MIQNEQGKCGVGVKGLWVGMWLVNVFQLPYLDLPPSWVSSSNGVQYSAFVDLFEGNQEAGKPWRLVRVEVEGQTGGTGLVTG